MNLPTSPATKYTWAAGVLVSSLSLTAPLLYWHHPWLYVWINLIMASLLALQLLLLQLPDILQARGLMHLNICKGNSLVLRASQLSSPASSKSDRRRISRRPR